MFAASKTASVSGGYQISRSLRFNQPDSAYLNRNFSTNGTSQKTCTISLWAKLSSTTTSQYRLVDGYNGSSGTSSNIRITNNQIILAFGGGSTAELITSAVYRDYSAWYHIVASIDSTQATSTDRMKLYINGVQVTAFSSSTYPTQNANYNFMCSGANNIIGGAWDGTTSQYTNGYMTEINFIDGQALTPSSFGYTNPATGVWSPLAFVGSYGTNGFYLNFSDNSNTTAATLGKDYSGNGNNWTPNNFSVTAGAGNDSLIDSPTAYGFDTGVGGTVRGNYATLNPLDKGPNVTITNGNLSTTNNYVGPPFECSRATIGVSSGKWYWEVTATTVSGNSPSVGVASASASITNYLGSDTQGWGYLLATGQKANNATFTSYGATVANGDIVGVALDMDAGTLTFYKNGTSQGQAFSSLSGILFPTIFSFNTSVLELNFGQRPFAYTAPSGFKALCTQNLPTPTIGATTATQAGKYFNTILWSGDGSGTRSLTGVGFQPTFSWTKTRNSSAQYHALFDAVRGGNKTLFSNSTLAENVNSASGYISSFDSDGFSVIGGNDTNGSGLTYVGWNWAGNGSGSTNTAGSITSTVSANTTSGFSVVTYTGNGTVGATVGHSLGVAPSMMFIKGRSNVDNWHVYSSALGNTGGLFLNLTSAFTVSSFFWNNTSPTSTVFTLSSGSSNNSNGVTYVAYCFSEVAGYSKFGSYTGNGSADGVFVYTGMRPAFVMIKRTDAVSSWEIHDTTRATYNVDDKNLYANLSDAEATYAVLDELSNGFKLRTTLNGTNASGGTYIYMAFATSPFKYSLAR